MLAQLRDVSRDVLDLVQDYLHENYRLGRGRLEAA